MEKKNCDWSQNIRRILERETVPERKLVFRLNYGTVFSVLKRKMTFV